MQKVIKSIQKKSLYLAFTGVILSNILIVTYLVTSGTLLTNGLYGIFLSMGVFFATAVTVGLINTKDETRDNAYAKILFTALFSMIVVLLVVTSLMDQIDYFSDCNELNDHSNYNLNVIDCINYMNENPESIGSEVLNALVSAETDFETEQEISIVDRQLLP